ncbi:unnamed protein product [Owenia fusiformis]|uniref:Uncharacterized protein n=1 Tax=Owenia fusiformis TaxID=6347 RepID=A0A8J1U3H6_OWEFU|nr:unnamed protein product [Owenia fusiformis]
MFPRGINTYYKTMENKFLIKLMFIGDSTVGKTSLIFRYVHGIFNEMYLATIGIDFKKRTIELQGKNLTIQLWDTGGQERFHSITQSYYRSAMGIFLVYDVTNPNSFCNVEKWMKNIEQSAKEDVVIFLLGNKADCIETRRVIKDVGKAKAAELNLDFLETSAKTDKNVKKAFEEMTKKVMAKIPEWVEETVKLNEKESKESKCPC